MLCGYQMGGNIITQSTEEKDLGITIGEKLKFQIHINNHIVKMVILDILIGRYN
jgi:hypothetical protein